MEPPSSVKPEAGLRFNSARSNGRNDRRSTRGNIARAQQNPAGVKRMPKQLCEPAAAIQGKQKNSSGTGSLRPIRQSHEAADASRPQGRKEPGIFSEAPKMPRNPCFSDKRRTFWMCCAYGSVQHVNDLANNLEVHRTLSSSLRCARIHERDFALIPYP